MMGPKTTARTLRVADHVWAAIELMAEETATSTEGLVNQALFGWAAMNGYLEPSAIAAAKVEPRSPPSPPPPEGTRWTGPRLVLAFRGRELVVESSRFLVGRDASCDLAVDSALLSRQHAAIHLDGAGIEVEDLGSSNGTWFDSERITRRRIASGDTVVFGDVSVRFELR